MTKTKTKKPHISPVLRMMQLAFTLLGPLLPKLMGNWAYRIWFTTVRFKTPAHEMGANDSAKRSVLEVNGIPVSVLSWGDAPYVLFIHGWTGRGTQTAPFLDGLTSAGYGVISFDGPAHGESPGKQTNILELTDVVVALTKKFGPFHAAITHSFGGMISAYAMRQGVNFEKVVSICPPADMDTIVESFRRSLSIPNGPIRVMMDKLEKEYGEDLWDKISTVNNVKKLDNKALIIHDENDDDVPWQAGQAIANAWKDSKFIRTQGLGHRRILRDAEVVKATVNFIVQ
jgi:pimeloyl-ACP methyl ester carboxylesterase